MTIYHYLIILLFLPTVSTSFDCREICDITIQIEENTPIEQLRWDLVDLLHNRTSTSFPFEQYQYSLSHTSEFFILESPILKFRPMTLDREKICEKISNKDEECALTLQIFTQTTYIILFKLVLLDQNDWRPYFKSDRIHMNIRENLPINYRVQLPIAYDHDSSQFNIDHYEFTNENHMISQIFKLEQNFEELRLKLLKTLNCEETNNYQLEIIAVDKGGLKSNVLHVNVTVDDVNEYQPSFKQPFYHTRLPENIPVTNTSIINVIASDDDCSDKIIVYSLLMGELPLDIFPFGIDRRSGSIFVKRELDYEKISTYRFRVRASNIDQVTSSFVPVIIDVLDLNDNPPSIQMNVLSEYKPNVSYDNDEDLIIHINENVCLNQVIGTVVIRDSDSAMINRKLSLKIISCWPTKNACPITLDSTLGTTDDNEKQFTGTTNYVIRTSRALDVEMEDDKYTIVVEARDYGDPSLSNQRRILIVIDDANDHRPEFTQKDYQFRLSETSPIGFLIGQLQAHDHDFSPDFRRLQYKLIDTENNNIIEIDPKNGSLYLIRRLSAGMTFNLTAMAIDQQNQSLYDEANVQIFVYDDATCLPTFTQQIYVFNTSEHEKTPYKIGQVYADSCLSLSIPISYHIARDALSAKLPFSVNSHDGVITVVRDLDRESQSFFKFRIDSLNHRTQQTSQTEVHIYVQDQNDHYPSFDNSFQTGRELFVFINKSIAVSRRHDRNQTKMNEIFIKRIHASDEDEGANGLVNYYFINSDNYAHFHLYANGSIVLYNANGLQLPYRLEVYARDQGTPVPLNSKETIVIYVCDASKREECSSDETIQNQSWLFGYNSNPNSIKISGLTTNFYLGSIFIMISVLIFIGIIIVCVVWNLIIKKQYRDKNIPINASGLKISNDSYNCRVEARKNLIVSESLYDSSPTITSIDGSHRLKSVAV